MSGSHISFLFSLFSLSLSPEQPASRCHISNQFSLFNRCAYLPQGRGHGEDAEDEVRDGQGHDEDVPGRPHALAAEHGPEDEDVAEEAHDDEDEVDEDEAPVDARRDRIDHVQVLLERPDEVLEVGEVAEVEGGVAEGGEVATADAGGGEVEAEVDRGAAKVAADEMCMERKKES